MTNLLYFFLPIFGIILGSFISKAKQIERFSSYLLHFLAGIVLGIVAIDITPQMAKKDIKTIVISYLLGIAFITIFQIIEKKIKSSKLAILGGVDLFIDGITLGLSFLISTATGIAISLSVLICSLFLSMGICSSQSKWSSMLILIISFALGLSAIFFFKVFFLQNIDSIYGFTIVALLYLTNEELLKKAHDEKDTLLSSFCFFSGFLILLLLT